MAIAACLWFVLAAAQMAGDPAAAVDGAILMQALHTLFGIGFAVRMAALVLLGAALASCGSDGHRIFSPLVLSGFVLAAPALTGHAAASSPAHFTAIGIIIDGLHLLTAGFWLGGLALLALLFACRTRRRAGSCC